MSTKIEWCDEVWNPTTGCTKVSSGCRSCYAERIANRFWGERKFSDVQCHPERLEIPLHWKKPRRVFVDSMSDLFHPDVTDKFIERVFIIMNRAQGDHHTYMILTKRPDRMNYFVNRYIDIGGWYYAKGQEGIGFGQWPLPNVWLGVSVEDQATTDERIPLLLQTPATKRFVSVEPALAPVNIRSYLPHFCIDCDVFHTSMDCYKNENNPKSVMKGIDWLIIGCESGPGARPIEFSWARSLRDQCIVANVPFFLKQWPILNGEIVKMPFLDGKQWMEIPE